MTTHTRHLIPVTDDRGRLLLGVEDSEEPLPGSVVLTEGRFGTAWQRHFSDGLWHRAGSHRAKVWSDITAKRNVVLVYNAASREAER